VVAVSITEVRTGSVPAATSGSASAELQATLLELIVLSLIDKQAHWNLTGPLFMPLHLEFDEISGSAREAADVVAERLEAIGVAADGRTATVAASSGLPAMPEGKLDGPTAARLVADRMGTIADRVRGRVRRLDSGDALSQDVLIELGRELEKQLWMLREQIS
jgi:starvation-inducible DNA-binding protein